MLYVCSTKVYHKNVFLTIFWQMYYFQIASNFNPKWLLQHNPYDLSEYEGLSALQCKPVYSNNRVVN